MEVLQIAQLLVLKVASFQKVRLVFQISKSQKKYIPKNYPELEIKFFFEIWDLKKCYRTF